MKDCIKHSESKEIDKEKKQNERIDEMKRKMQQMEHEK